MEIDFIRLFEKKYLDDIDHVCRRLQAQMSLDNEQTIESLQRRFTETQDPTILAHLTQKLALRLTLDDHALQSEDQKISQ